MLIFVVFCVLELKPNDSMWRSARRVLWLIPNPWKNTKRLKLNEKFHCNIVVVWRTPFILKSYFTNTITLYSDIFHFSLFTTLSFSLSRSLSLLQQQTIRNTSETVLMSWISPFSNIFARKIRTFIFILFANFIIIIEMLWKHLIWNVIIFAIVLESFS